MIWHMSRYHAVEISEVQSYEERKVGIHDMLCDFCRRIRISTCINTLYMFVLVIQIIASTLRADRYADALLPSASTSDETRVGG
jgi:hypothetical protein